MRNKPLSYLPSGDYVINSLVDGPNGNRFITGAMGRILAIVPSPGFSPQKLHVELVDGSKHIYVITVDDKNTRDEDHLVYANHREAQKWDIAYRQQWNAYTIVKLGTREAWTDINEDDGHRDSDGPHQIRLEPLTGPIRSNYYDIRRNQLFNFGVPQEHKLHSGSYRIYSLVSNQPLGIQPILGRRHENPVAGPADPWMHPPPDPVIVPVPNATPQTFTVQQVKGSEDTYLITIEGRYTQDDGNVVYALQGPPVQEWAITYWQEQNAYTIVKLNTDQAWTHPSQDGSDDRHDPGDSHQICLKPLTGAHRGTLYEINPNQLFRFEVPREHKLLSGNYRIHSLVSNQSLGIQPIMGRRPENPVVGPIHLQPNTTAGPVVVPVPSAFPQIFSVQRVKGSEDAYLITIQDKYTLDDGNVVYALQGPPVQEWVITYRQEQNAYTIGKLNTDQAWTDHGQHGRDGRLDPDNPRQIRLEPLIGMNPGDYSNVYLNQLFRFEAPRPHDLPSGNHGNHFFVSNQPGDPVVKPAHLQTHSIADPVVAPAPSVTPQTFTVQQANGSQNTCIITIQSKYTPNEQNLIHAPQSPPAQEWVITHSIGQAAAPPTTACAKHQVTVKLQFL